MKKIFIIVILLEITFVSCSYSENVIIKVVAENKMYEKELPANTTDLVFDIGQFTQVQKQEGLEKLKELKKLYIKLGGFFSDYSFLKNFEKLETLIMPHCMIDNIDFLDNLKNLEVLILENCTIYKNKIDLKNNKKLKYLSYNVIYYEPHKTINVEPTPIKPFSPNIINIPEGLDYLNISQSLYIILSRELLNNIVKVPHVLLGDSNFEYYAEEYKKRNEFAEVYKSYIDNKVFILSHPNFVMKKPEEVLPEKYREDTLFPIEKILEQNFWDKMNPPPAKTYAAKATSITATSFINYQGMYSPYRAFDGDYGTAWLENAKDSGIGESITLMLDREITIDEIFFMPGYFDNKWWQKNNRIKKIAVESAGKIFSFDFDDVMIDQTKTLPSPLTFSKIRFVIKEVYRSSGDNDTALSEVMFYHQNRKVELDMSGVK